MENTGNMKALFIITNAGFVEDITEVVRKVGVRGATILNARGEGAQHKSFMGITIDTEKEVILTIVDESVAENAMAVIKEQMGIKTASHSFCFTMPVEKTLGLSMPVPQPEEQM